jgi:SAM-dependent methyltransferase
MNIMNVKAECGSYRDPNTLYKFTTNVGSVDTVTFVDSNIVVSNTIDVKKAANYDFDSIIALDKAGRFVSMGAINVGIGVIKISKADVGRDSAAWAVTIYAMSSNHNFIYPLAQSPSRQNEYSNRVRNWFPENTVDVPSIKESLSSLIVDAVKLPYVATSIHGGIKTGNSYQTLFLGEGSRTTGRYDRMSYLSEINFREKSVLDLGANTGEMSRSVRTLGARLVDGYEYDPYFVEIGRAVNALVGATRVSLFQGDCTRAALYENFHYDIVLALNVWVYIEKVISIIKDIAPIFVFETHTLDHGINFYYSRLCPWFSAATCLGLTDVGDDPHKSRAFIVFANSYDDINTHVHQEFVEVKPYFRNLFLERTGILTQREALDLAARCFAERSDAKWGAEDHCSFGREGYFDALLAGFHQFMMEDYKVSDENFYLKFFAYGVTKGVIDDKMTSVAENAKWLKRKIENKFEDMQNIMCGFFQRVPPIKLVEQAEGGFEFTTSDGEKVRCSEIDGHHRFFAAQLMGVRHIQCQIVRDEKSERCSKI